MSSAMRDIETQISKMGYSDEKAERIYYVHVKPLEDALAEAEAGKADMRDTLKCIVEEIECVDDECRCEEVAEIARAALARAKGVV